METYRDILEHHGIKGMKWGIRRYRNEDGSLTSEGKKRYSEDYNRSYDLKKKNVKSLSNEELKFLVERKELEQKYLDKGNNEAKKIIANATAKFAVNAATVGAIYLGAKYLKKKYNLNVETITKGVVDTAGKVAATAGKEVAKGGVGVAKVAGEAVANKAHDVRKAAASSEVARNYVKTMDNVVGKVNNAGSGYVKTVDSVMRKADNAGSRVASSKAARGYVKTVDKLLEVAKKKRR